jgi:hypothetical protein
VSTYLTRPVFDFTTDWGSGPAKTFDYPLNESLIGFSLPRYEPIQTYVSRGHEFDVLLASQVDIDAFEAFVEASKGRLIGFWMPVAERAFEIVAGVNTSSFKIADQRLRDMVSEESCLHVIFQKSGESDRYAKISTVASDGNGLELVTLTGALSTAVDETWAAYWLRYVRFTDDRQEAQYLGNRLQKRTVKAIELPQEYTTISTGEQPVYLYHFSMQADTARNWYFTGLNESITSNLQLYTTYPINHGSYTRSLKSEDTGLSIESWHESENPMALLYPNRLPRPLWVTIYETTFANPDTVTTIFHGMIDSIKLMGQQLTAKAVPLLSVAGRKFPRFLIQPRCNYSLFSTPCGLSKTSYRISGTVATTSPAGKNVLEISISGACARNYLAGGWIEAGTGATWEIVGIMQNAAKDGSNKVKIQLEEGLQNVTASAAVYLYPGCDGQASTCKATFNNFNRWGGHVIAPTNLSVQAVENQIAQGVNKK